MPSDQDVPPAERLFFLDALRIAAFALPVLVGVVLVAPPEVCFAPDSVCRTRRGQAGAGTSWFSTNSSIGVGPQT